MRNLPFLIIFLLVSWNFARTNSTVADEILKYDLENTDTLVDIGCGDGVHDKTIAHQYPNLFLVLEDLAHDFKNHDIKKHLAKYFRNSPYTPTIENRFRFTAGTTDSIFLPTATYKRVLCRKTLHEFVNKEKMAAELKRILSKDGVLIIVEKEPNYEGEVDRYCKRQYVKKSDIIELFKPLKLRDENSVTYHDEKLNILKFGE